MKGRTMPSKATLSLSSHDDTTASFTAVYSAHNEKAKYSLWVACNGYDTDGVHRSASFAAVVWDGSDGTVTLPLNADPAHPVAVYKASVVLFRDVWAPVSNTVEFTA